MCEPIRVQEVKLEGGWLMVRPVREDLGKAMAAVRQMKPGKPYDLELKQHRQRRSLDANAYAWVLMARLAEAMHIPKEDVYRQQIPNVGGNSMVLCLPEKDAARYRALWERQGVGWVTEDLGKSKVPKCRNIMVYQGSSTFDTRQMAAMIDNLIQDCKALGIETKSPEEIRSLIDAWDGR